MHNQMGVAKALGIPGHKVGGGALHPGLFWCPCAPCLMLLMMVHQHRQLEMY